MKLLESLKTRWVAWVWNHTPNCAQMSRLASQSLDRRLSPGLRIRMRLHYLICGWCKRYSKQLQFLRQAAPRLGARPGDFMARGLSTDARQRILRRVQNAQAG